MAVSLNLNSGKIFQWWKSGIDEVLRWKADCCIALMPLLDGSNGVEVAVAVYGHYALLETGLLVKNMVTIPSLWKM